MQKKVACKPCAMIRRFPGSLRLLLIPEGGFSCFTMMKMTLPDHHAQGKRLLPSTVPAPYTPGVCQVNRVGFKRYFINRGLCGDQGEKVSSLPHLQSFKGADSAHEIEMKNTSVPAF